MRKAARRARDSGRQSGRNFVTPDKSGTFPPPPILFYIGLNINRTSSSDVLFDVVQATVG